MSQPPNAAFEPNAAYQPSTASAANAAPDPNAAGPHAEPDPNGAGPHAEPDPNSAGPHATGDANADGPQAAGGPGAADGPSVLEGPDAAGGTDGSDVPQAVGGTDGADSAQTPDGPQAAPVQNAEPEQVDALPDGPWYPAEPPTPPRRPGLTAAQAIGVVVAVSALGWPLGLLWQAIAPNVPVLIVADGAVYNDTQPEQFMGGDGWFVVLGLLFGIAVAVVTWLTCRQLRGPLGILVLAAGATVAGVLAWRTGRQIGLSEYLAGLHSAPEGTHLGKPNDLRVAVFQWWPPRLTGVPLIPTLGATLTMTILAAWSSFANLRSQPEPPSYAEPGTQPDLS